MLFKIINFTKTHIGKRYLQTQLSMPLIDPTELNKRYETIDVLLKNSHTDKLVKYLEDIYDLDKLIRKLEINMISPGELYQIYISFYQINKLSGYLLENNSSGWVIRKICRKSRLVRVHRGNTCAVYTKS